MHQTNSFQLSVFFVAVITITVGFVGCTDSPTSSGKNDDNTRMEYTDTIFVVSQDGMKWDITYAVRYLDMDSASFRNGGGGFSSRPILYPEFLSEGDAGYPLDSEAFPVVGISVNGESRAYPPTAIGANEVVDEVFGSNYLAVAY
jgi:hypothetical protein